jgi:hypothetical protein
MPVDPSSLITFLGAALIAGIMSSRSAAKGAMRQQEIVQRGVSAEGRVVRLWQPPLAGSFARVYFEYEPQGASGKIECCHIDRRSLGDPRASLPSVGASVAVRYLPESPANAVIAKLVSRFTR